MLIIAPLDLLFPLSASQIGRHFLHGALPYRDFQFEYPPLAIFAFILPGLVPSTLAKSVLALQALAVETLIFIVVLRKRPDAAWRYLALSILAFPFLSGGFDAFPMAAIAISTELLVEGNANGWWVAAAGTRVKLSPATAWLWARRKLRTSAAALIVTGIVGLAPLALVKTSTDSYLGYTLQRGVQAESVAASVRWLANTLRGRTTVFAYRFRAWEIDGAGGIAAFLTIAALAAMAFLAIKWTNRNGWLLSFSSVALLLCGSKVLSPQFIAWLAPVVAVIGGPLFWLYSIVTALTILAYSSDHVTMGVIFCRNVALVGSTGYAMWQLYRNETRQSP